MSELSQVHIINDDLGSLDTGLMGSIVLAALLSVLYLSTSASVLIGGWCSDFAEVYTWLGVVTTSSIWLGTNAVAWTSVFVDAAHGASIKVQE